MTAHITIDEVQAWFTEDRLSLEHDDSLSEEPTISEEVLSRCNVLYDVSTWTDDTTTPVLIRKIIAARVAAARYRKHYADQLDEIPYADKLDDWAMTTLTEVVEGKLELLDVSSTITDGAFAAVGPAFYPDDQTGVSDEDSQRKFTMGQVF